MTLPPAPWTLSSVPDEYFPEWEWFRVEAADGTVVWNECRLSEWREVFARVVECVNWCELERIAGVVR